MTQNKKWTDEEVAQIRKDKEVSTIQDLTKLYNLTEGQVIHALYRYKRTVIPKLVIPSDIGLAASARHELEETQHEPEQARPAFFSYEWWFGEGK